MKEIIRMLYAYNAWANERIRQTAAQLTAEQFAAKGGASFESVQATLAHIMGAQWAWLMRWQGTSPPSLLNAADYPTLEAIAARWAVIERDTQAFVAGLDDDGLRRVVSYRNTQGKPYAYPLWQIMLHQVNHSTQHRSEIAVSLTQFGHSPGGMDMTVFFDKAPPKG